MEKSQESNREHLKIIKKDDDKFDLKEFVSFILITAAIVIPIRMFIAQPFVVNGESMKPTFETGQYLIVDQLSYKIHEPQRGDVIVFKYPEDETKYFIKRIVGLPGETVEINEKTVEITKTNGEKITLSEPYIKLEKDSFNNTKLADDEYFVMGDNRSASLDSRVWGPLKKYEIVGQAFVRLLPFSEIDYLPGDFDF